MKKENLDEELSQRPTRICPLRAKVVDEILGIKHEPEVPAKKYKRSGYSRTTGKSIYQSYQEGDDRYKYASKD
jgi:hypothetical protein